MDLLPLVLIRRYLTMPNELEDSVWDHFCFSSGDVVRLRKKTDCERCGKSYIHPAELEIKNKFPYAVWNNMFMVNITVDK